MGNWAALGLGVGLIGWAATMRILTGTWLNPGAFFSLFWCFAGILPLVFAPEEPVGWNAMLWLIAASIAVSAGTAIGNGGLKTVRLRHPSPATDRELILFGWVLALSVGFGLISNIAFLAGSGIPLSDVFDISKLVVVSNQLYVERSMDVGAPPAPFLSQ